ncbi:mucin-binding protein [Lactobacillus paragasseri]|uniref:mucin-binding protein n=1 Tax=Lactobacillus paragasseri TaxID=2107999 RepID=UPI002550EEB0|nr:YSIRK-type signal peptide-containing protein [Lactobacillus paragasseri]MDK7953379.1 YSIRK-type signal peptide-containing protein [Lactobacillus paragasseri]MDX5060622.1 YSIRK-type signal peptide-containing protein [Lactobacillus paragasseri]
MSHKNDLSFIAKLNGKEKFSLRKLSVGLVTVALGTTFFLESSNTAHAAEVDTTNQNVTSQESTSDSLKSRTLNIQKTKATEDSTTSTKPVQNNEQTSVNQTSKNSGTTVRQETNLLATKSEKANTTQASAQAINFEEEIQTTTDQNQSTAVSITGDDANKSMMANVTQGTIRVHINQNKESPITINNGQKITVSIAATNNLLRFSTPPSKINDFEISTSQTNTNKIFTFTYTGSDDGILSNFNPTFYFTADNDATKQYKDIHGTYPDFNLPVTVTLFNNQKFTQNLPIKITPYKDLVVTKEILHGFVMGPKLIGTPGQDGYPGNNGSYTENGATYYGPEPSAAADVPADKQKSARLMQYALEWNYGSAKDPSLNPLMNVLANIKFNNGQVILPSTIKAFKIPADMEVVDSEGQRVPINKYYGNLATLPEDTNFEKFLRDSISSDKKQITIDQKGNFTVNGVDYSTMGPYFIQLDTLLNPNAIDNWASNPDSGVGPSITTPIVNENDWKHSGSGSTTNTSTQTYTDFKFDPAVDRVVRIYFIDENTDKEIPDTVRSIIAKTNSTIDNPTSNIINDLKKQGYVLDKQATNGETSDFSKNLKNYNISNQNFKTDSLENNYNSQKINIKDKSLKYYVYLYHGTEPVSDKKTIKETINYVYANGTQEGKTAVNPYDKTVSYTRTGTNDLVTDHITWKKWQPDSSFNAVESPNANDKNYTLVDKDEIPAIKLNIDNDGKITTEGNVPLIYTVHYYAPEHARLTFYDDTENQNLSDYLTKNGQKASLTDTYSELDNNSSKQPISFTDADNIVNFLKNNHYIFTGVSGNGSITNSDYSKIAYGNFDNDETKDQEFILHFKHALDNQNETAVVAEKVNYVYENGPHAGKTVVDAATSPIDQKITYTRTRTVDLVNDPKGENTKWSNWTPDKAFIENFNLPEKVSGLDNQEKIYSLDLAQVKATKDGKVFDYSSLKLPFETSELSNDKTINLKVTIPYTLAENITVNYIDDTTGKTLESKSLSGKPNTEANYSTKDTIDKYVAQNYVLVSDPTNQAPLSFDNDELPNNQNYEVHFKHGIGPVSNKKTVTETIHYIYKDGSPAAKDATNQLTFTETGTKDLVTGTTDTKWSAPQTFASVTSPTISGYTPDQLKIDTIKVDHNSQNIEKTVIYNADKQGAVLRFYDDTEGKFIDFAKDLKTDGTSKSTISFTIPSNYDFSNYNFVAVNVGNDPKNITTKLSGDTLSDVTYGKFDTNDQVDQYFIAHFTHKTNDVKENKSISEKVVLYAENGPKKGQALQTIELGNTGFTRNGQKDLVTNQVSWETWTIENNSHAVSLPVTFSTVYKIDPTNITQTTPVSKKFEINNQIVSPLTFNATTDQDLIKSLANSTEFMVKVPYELTENVNVTYIDDTTGKTLETKSLSGEPNTNSQYSTKDTIDKYVANNYVLISDPTDQKNIFYDNDEKPNNQNYDVHFKHAFKEINNSKTVNETITYIYDNGKEAAPTYNTSVEFTQAGKLDLVTNKEELNDWSPVSNTFIAVTSPVIKNYTADQKQIAAQAVQPNSSDLSFQVVYTAVPVQPTKPTEPTKPVQPTKPTVPTKPVQPAKPAKSTQTQLVRKNNETKSPISSHLALPTNAASHETKKTEENNLPQTGAKPNDASLIGLAFGATSFLLGLVGSELKRKRKN